MSGSGQVCCRVSTVEQDDSAGLLDRDVNAARESVVHAVESDQQATGINDGNILRNDRVGFLHGSSNEAVSLVN